LSGNYQLLQLEPWLLSRTNPIRFAFVSHKLFRLVVPFALCGALVTSFFLPGPVYRVALVLQMAFYSLSAWALVRLKHNPLARVSDAALTFVLLNTAAIVAFANFVTSRKAAWVR
jgi:poly-beta-1,6-N-acetyl-D-glucosamine synthase